MERKSEGIYPIYQQVIQKYSKLSTLKSKLINKKNTKDKRSVSDELN